MSTDTFPKLPITVLGLAILLALAVLMLPVAKRLKIPHTILLALVGCLLGGIAAGAGDTPTPGIVGEFLHFLRHFQITSDAVLFLFVPALVFESAIAINVHRLMHDLIPILALAVVGLLVSTGIVGYSLFAVADRPLLVCLLLGAIVSATDPVAVMALFKELQAPKRLAILVEGESLFNDATAIVLFTLLSGMVLHTEDPSLMGGAAAFLEIFFGGALTGYVLARLLCALFNRIPRNRVMKITLTICLAYLSFAIAEHVLHVSGVMAVVTAGLVMGSIGHAVISPSTWQTLGEIWEHIGFGANSFIFLLVGIAAPEIMLAMTGEEFVWLLVLIVAAFAARALILYGILPAFTIGNWVAEVSTAYKTVLFWGGLRGAVPLALALAVMENPAYPEPVRGFIGVLVTGLVLFTLFVNGTTLNAVMHFFGLHRLSPADQTIHHRAMEVALLDISDRLETAVKDMDVAPDRVRALVKTYRKRAEEMKAGRERSDTISQDDWRRIGLTVLTQQERYGYLKLLEGGLVNAKVARLLLARVEDLLDGLRQRSVEGYVHACERSLDFNGGLRMAAQGLSRLGFPRWLSELLDNRFALLISQKRILKSIQGQGIDALSVLMGDELGRELSQILERRYRDMEDALATLKRQHPAEAERLENRYLSQVALRLEDLEFQGMLEHAVISRDVFNRLEQELESSARQDEKRPQWK
ncbi:cation:proton antiporter [Nitrospina gracilis]|uniref:cation:proton antiporter n=1 Tax=Nitrospina gracilis TaxID=35801 RepID=UPI001F004776|nr:cation:proton antiporter [Nitrospina gracilis]